jgi:hypothetical protein
MANVNSPFGFRPVRHQSGGCVRLNEYSIASGYDTDIFQGDVVEMTGTGKNIAIVAAANADNLGVFWGCRYVDAQGNQQFSKYWPANTTATDIVALVYDDPNIVYEAQVDTIVAADIGTLMDLAVGTGSALTGVSGAYLDQSTAATTGCALRVLELKPSPDNEYGDYAKVNCVFAEHVMKGVVAGVGGI